jgi:hypothetical protein
MSRHWQLAQGLLTINDHENQPLAQLKFAGGQFQGQSTAGTPVTLSYKRTPWPNFSFIASPSPAMPTAPR